MNIYFEKVVELGNLILASEESLRLADAKAAFEADEAAQADYTAFLAYQENLTEAENYQEALAWLVQMEIDLKSKPVVQEYLKADSCYTNFANGIMQMLKLTVLKDTENDSCGGCCGK